MPKLTKPQRVLLAEIAEAPIQAAPRREYHQDLKLLHSRELIAMHTKPQMGFHVTEAGRAALAAQPD